MESKVSVFQYATKSKKLWGYRFEVEPAGGKRKWCTKRGFASQKSAASAGETARKICQSQGKAVLSPTMTYGSLLDRWLDSLDGLLKLTTIRNYQKEVRLYIKPYIGRKKLCDLRKDDIRRLMVTLQKNGCAGSDNGLSANTLSVIKGILQKSLSFAVDEGIIRASPVTGRFPMPRAGTCDLQTGGSSHPHTYIPPPKIQEIFERFPEGTSDHIALMLGYKCGLRLGEAFAVTWDDIDFENGILRIRRQVQWAPAKDTAQAERASPKKEPKSGAESPSGYWYLSSPKYNSQRNIKMDEDLLALLRREREQQEKDRAYFGKSYQYYCVSKDGKITKWSGSGSQKIAFINVRRNGEYISPRTMQHTSSVIHRELEYPDFTFHSLRHTHATMLVEHGAAPIYVQHRLGHKNLNVTMNVYFHYTEKMEENGSNVLASLFQKPPPVAISVEPPEFSPAEAQKKGPSAGDAESPERDGR